MIEFRKEGIYCPQADVYIDPWYPVKQAIITHGHSDHARRGHHNYLCHMLSKEILKLRLVKDITIQTLENNETITIHGVKFIIDLTGHLKGLAQFVLE